MRTGKKHSKTRRVHADFFEEGGKIVLKKMDSFGQILILEENAKSFQALARKHTISDGRLENLACTSATKNTALSLI